MPIYKLKDSWSDKVTKFDSARSAVEDAVAPDAYSYDGKLERLESMVDTSTALMGRLLDVLTEKNLLTDKDVVKVLGWGYTTQPDGSADPNED